MGRFQSILGTVGNTPVVRINRLAPAGVEAGAARPGLAARKGLRSINRQKKRSNGFIFLVSLCADGL